MGETLSELEARRRHLFQELAALGDFRPGMISVNYRKCGKRNCACAEPGHQGHGPQEHLADLSKLVYGAASAKAKQWTTARLAQLDEGDVESLLVSLRRLRPTATQAVRQTISYFGNNRERMRYAQFRRQELFGSGVIEAGCKTIVGQRLRLLRSWYYAGQLFLCLALLL